VEQNIIDTAVKEWRKFLDGCVRIMGLSFEQFYRSQWKNGQLNKMSPKVLKM